MRAFLHLLRDLHDDESGANAIEYALIGAIVSVGIIAGLTAWANSANGLFEYVTDTVTGALGS